MNPIVEKCKEVLKDHYGPQFAGLVLYGSMARGDSGSESDIDLLVLLNQPLDFFHELRTIVELLYPLQLESDRLISARPAAVEEFENGAVQLYRNAKSEGVSV
ncbi:MAG: nucleotidyltransferase domain-containing protein [bacterium]